MGKKLIIIGADFSENAIDGVTNVCVLVNTQTGYYFDNTGTVVQHKTTPYSDIRIYRVTPGAQYVLHGPTPAAAAYGVMAQLSVDEVTVGNTYTLISGPTTGQSSSYTYTFTAPTRYIGITDPGYELGTHSYLSLPE